jgi:hypothetical protein
MSGNLQHEVVYNWTGWRPSLYKHSSAEVNVHCNSDGFTLRLICKQRRTCDRGYAFCGPQCSWWYLWTSVSFTLQVNRSLEKYHEVSGVSHTVSCITGPECIEKICKTHVCSGHIYNPTLWPCCIIKWWKQQITARIITAVIIYLLIYNNLSI